MALMTALKKINDAREAYEQAVADLKVDAIVAGLAPLIPAGHHISWRQYAPYFNDGDPCVFRVRDCYLVKDEHANGDRHYDEEHGYGVLDFIANRWCVGTEAETGIAKSVMVNLVEAWDALDEAVLKAAFGDDNHVRVYADGRHSVDEWSHD